ncbi:MAG: C40 family peptidase [Bacteroidota bacterium]
MPELIEKGVCRLSVVPVRVKPLDSSEMLTQLLFGEHYSVFEENSRGTWVRIKMYYDGYEGWIDKRQHYPISDAYFDQINSADYKVCIDRNSSILFKKRTLSILMGSVLPIASTELFEVEEQFAFNGESKNLGDVWDFDRLKQIAFKYLNSPYLWGGKSPYGIDCSGFTQMVFKICGYRLERDASMQSKQGRAVKSIKEAIPGDLCFFGTKTKIDHVGIFLEANRVVHSSGYVRISEINEEGSVILDGGLKTHRLQKIRRAMPK